MILAGMRPTVTRALVPNVPGTARQQPQLTADLWAVPGTGLRACAVGAPALAGDVMSWPRGVPGTGQDDPAACGLADPCRGRTQHLNARQDHLFQGGAAASTTVWG